MIFTHALMFIIGATMGYQLAIFMTAIKHSNLDDEMKRDKIRYTVSFAIGWISLFIVYTFILAKL